MWQARIPFPVLALLMGCLLSACPPPKATIDIDYDSSPEYTVSPYLCGGFIEFIGQVINGRTGLWAQELVDRGFDWPDDNGDGVSDGATTYGQAAWHPLTIGHTTGGWELDTAGYNQRGIYSQKVYILSFEDGVRGVAQDGIPLRGDTGYDVYLHLKGENIEGGVTVSLSDPDTGEIYATSSFQGISGTWERYEAHLDPGVSARSSLFSISLGEEGILWIDEASLMATDAIGGVRSDYVAMLRELKPSPLRYPGGCFADGDGNHFVQGIGPIDHRPANWDNAWGSWQRMDFGFDEYISLCRLIGIEPQITVNFGSAAPEEAANWVEYANGDISTFYGGLRAGFGHPEPYGVRFWEVGNEQYGDWEIGHTTAEQYASTFNQFAELMKEKDPNILVMADGCHDRQWTRTVLEIAGYSMDYITLHMTAPDLGQIPCDNDKVFRAMMAAPLVQEAFVRELEAGIEQLGLSQVRIGVSEWWVTYNYPFLGPLRAESLEAGLYTAGMLNIFQRTGDIVDFANRTTFIAILKSAFESYPVFYGTPAFWALALYAGHSGPIPVNALTQSPTYDSSAVGSIPAMDSVPYIDVSVTSNNEKLYAMVINRHPSQEIQTTLSVTGCQIKETGQAHTLTSRSYLDTNRTAPHNLVSVRTKELEGLSQTFVYKFPPHSLTCLELEIR